MGLADAASIVLVTFVGCPVEPLSLLLDIVGDVAEVVFVEVLLSTVQFTLRLPGLSCSSMANASISACSVVNVNVPKELDDAPTPWPWGSIDATENPLPPPAPVDIGESVCLMDVIACSVV